jgi:DNA-binding CsgD family transcriptional regulator
VASELVELSSVIADIYDAALDPTLWQQTLANISAYVGGYAAVLFWHDAATQNAQAFYLFNDDPNYTRLYFEKYLSMDPFFPASSFIEAGVVYRSSAIVPQAELEQTQFYKEWIEPQGIVDAIAVNLEKGVTRSSFLAIRTNATYGPADDLMLRRTEALVPHLQRAVTIGRLFNQSRDNERVLSRTLDLIEAAVFLVTFNGVISFANEPATNMVEDATLLRVVAGVLQAVAPNTNQIMHDVFAAAQMGDESLGLRGIAIPLADATLDRWYAHVLPLTSGRRKRTGSELEAVAAVFVRKTPPNAPLPLEAIAKRFGLLPSESRVLDAMTKVQGVRDLAIFLGISEATVKTHLQNLFRKTGTNRQRALTKLVEGFDRS